MFNLSFCALLFVSLLFAAICKASPDSHYAFLHFFSMGMVLIQFANTRNILVICFMKKINSHFSHGLLSPELEYTESMQSSNQNLLLTVHKMHKEPDRRGNLSAIKGWDKIPAKGDTLPSSVFGSAAPVHHLEDTYTL